MARDMTLAEWKAYFAAKFLGYHQRGPGHVAGWERDEQIRRAVAKARTWSDVNAAVPLDWEAAAANRCRREEV